MPYAHGCIFASVLGKLKDFLGIMAESNKKLQQDAMVRELLMLTFLHVFRLSYLNLRFYIQNSKNFDIEALTGDESEYIEMVCKSHLFYLCI